MNLTAHQFITDWRHFRLWVAAAWLCFAAQLALPLADTSYGLDEPMLILQIVIGVFMVNRLIQADGVTGTTAGWLTRPIRRRHLFCAKLGFILFCLILPRLAVQSVDCLARGYSVNLWLAVLAEGLLYSLAVTAGAAALSALTPNMPRFFLAAGAGFVSVVLCVALLEAWARRIVDVWWSYSMDNSAMAACLALFVAASAFAWGCQALARRRALGAVIFSLGALSMPFVDNLWRADFLKPRQTLLAPLPVQVLAAPGGGAAAPGSRRLWNIFSVDNIPARQVAVAEEITARFQPEPGAQTWDLQPYWPTQFPTVRGLPANTPQAPEYFQIIRGFFPPETLWFGEKPIPAGSATRPLSMPAVLVNEQSVNKQTGSPARRGQAGGMVQAVLDYNTPGLLTGTLDMDLFEVVKAAEIPLRPATIHPQPGQSVSIRRVAPDFNGIRVDLEESAAVPMFSRLPYGEDALKRQQSFFTYVLYHAESGEACTAPGPNGYSVADVMGDVFDKKFSLSFSYPQLRQRLAGVSLQDWLRQARLCVFTPVYNGTFHAPFRQEHYAMSNAWDWSRQEAFHRGLEDIQNLTLPVNPTDARVAAYLDSIFLHLQDDWSGDSERSIILRKITAIGSNGVPELIRRLPADANVESFFILPAVRQLAGRRDLPELREALRRDPDAVDIFVKKNWEDDARDILAGLLSDHRLPLPAAALRIVARAHNPADYAGLAWHFVRLSYGQEEVIAELRQCPGFDLDDVLREAWKRAQLGIIPKDGLAAAAAAAGLPGAMNSAVMLMEAQSGKDDRQLLALRLAALTAYDGPPEKAADWLSANLDRLRYDPQTRRYVEP